MKKYRGFRGNRIFWGFWIVVVFLSAPCFAEQIRQQVQVNVTVLDSVAPTIHKVSAQPALPQAANHSMVPVTLQALVTDNSEDSVRWSITEVSAQDKASHKHENRDWVVTGENTLLLRAEQTGPNAVRSYKVTVTARDASGNVRDAQILVPIQVASSR